MALAAGIYFWRRERRSPVQIELPRAGAYVAQGYNAQLPVPELSELDLPQKKHVAEVAGDHGVHEIMGSEVHR